MAITINGSGSITGLSAGAISSNDIASLAATKLTGQVPDANAPSGSVLQVVSTTKTDQFSTSSSSFTDVTGLSVSITPINSSNKILVLVTMMIGADTEHAHARIMRDGTAIYIGDASGSADRASMYGLLANFATNGTGMASAIHLDSPATTSSVTYKVQANNPTGNATRINMSANGGNSSTNHIRGASSITVMEIAA